MASPEQGKSSNSPNVKVTELKIEGTNGSVLRVHLDNGSLFLLDADHPSALALRVGDELDEVLLSHLESASVLYHCRSKALSLLSSAEQCRWGLTVKLTKKGFPREAISESLDRLSSSGLLDDRRFAETWVRSRLRGRAEGPSRLRAALMSKGISGTIAHEAVETILEELGDEEGNLLLERAWEKLSPRTGMSEDKLLTALVRRGFPVSHIRSFLRDRNREKEQI